MTEKQKYEALSLLASLFFIISGFIMFSYESIRIEAYALLSLGWLLWGVAYKKEKAYKKSNR